MVVMDGKEYQLGPLVRMAIRGGLFGLLGLLGLYIDTSGGEGGYRASVQSTLIPLIDQVLSVIVHTARRDIIRGVQ